MSKVSEFLHEYEALVAKYSLFIGGEPYWASVRRLDDSDAEWAREDYEAMQAELWAVCR